jgi:hypothetical protein
MFVLIYVDDIIIARSTQCHTSSPMTAWPIFSLKDLGELNFFMRIEANRMNDGLLLMHEKYASDLLKKVGMGYCKRSGVTIVCQ